MEEHLERYVRFERLYQAVSWVGAAGLGLAAVFSRTLTSSQKPSLFTIAVLLGVVSSLFVRKLPLRSAGRIAYGPEDKAFVESLVMIVLITAYLYLFPFSPSAFFLLLFPIIIETTILRERLVLAEASLAFIAIVFLRVGSAGPMSLQRMEFFVETAIFFAIIALMYVLTRLLGQAHERNDVLAAHLSRRIDHIRVISRLVQQSEYFQELDNLLDRIGKIVAEAFETERCGFFLADTVGEPVFHPISVGFGEREKRLLTEGTRLAALWEACRGKTSIIVNDPKSAKEEGLKGFLGEGHFRNLIILPLCVGGRDLGFVVVADKISRPFGPDDRHLLEVLGGLIATLIDSARAFGRIEDEKRTLEKMTRLFVGRELRMRELKERMKMRRL